MGRWAQAQRRGGFVTAAPACSPNIVASAVQFTWPGPPGVGQQWNIHAYLECIPAGAAFLTVFWGSADCGDDSASFALPIVPQFMTNSSAADGGLWLNFVWSDLGLAPIGLQTSCVYVTPP